jgi:hypothetical protein
VNGNIFNSKGVHVGVVMDDAVFSLKGQKLYDLKGSNIYKLNGDLARPIREGTVFLVRLTWPQASSDEAHRIAFGFSPPVTTGTLQRA